MPETTPTPDAVDWDDLPGLDGQPLDSEELAGKTVLVVNVASKCGLTPQYEGLERLQRTYGDRGFTVLGIPCNQFAGSGTRNAGRDRRLLPNHLRDDVSDDRQA
jgi:glutathione peroxidase-family protein